MQKCNHLLFSQRHFDDLPVPFLAHDAGYADIEVLQTKLTS